MFTFVVTFVGTAAAAVVYGYAMGKQSEAAAAAAAGGVAGVDGAGGVLTFSTLIEAPT
jgi:hypothetical protein